MAKGSRPRITREGDFEVELERERKERERERKKRRASLKKLDSIALADVNGFLCDGDVQDALCLL